MDLDELEREYENRQTQSRNTPTRFGCGAAGSCGNTFRESEGNGILDHMDDIEEYYMMLGGAALRASDFGKWRKT